MHGSHRLINTDVVEGLAGLDAGSVQCCVTSPPYWGLRDYGVEGQLGLEPTPQVFVERLVGVFGAVRRVLRDDGVLFVNLGDSYANSSTGGGGPVDVRTDGRNTTPGDKVRGRLEGVNTMAPGLRPKSLVGVPERFALAMMDSGWIWRSRMPWVKRSAMPESCRDRPASAVEYVLMFVKQPRYFWDGEAVRRKENKKVGTPGHIAGGNGVRAGSRNGLRGKVYESGRSFRNTDLFLESLTAPHGLIQSADGEPLALDVNPQPFAEAHFATFPEALIRPLIQAGSAEGDTVLDPFAGSGTTLLVACQLGRDAIGIELSAEYVELAESRIGRALKPSTYVDHTGDPGPLFAEVAS